MHPDLIAGLLLGAIVLTTAWLIWKRKTTLKAVVIGAVALPLLFLVWSFEVVGIPSGWSGIEPFILAPFIGLVGAGIGAIFGAILAIVKSKFTS